jgi:phosphatidylethanolamine/phosphatidyl-N-methylethanolamine N-methyltransferase
MRDLVYRAKFLAEFIQKPLSIGALAPSSGHLARTMVRDAGLSNADVALEYGAGTGGLTRHILSELGPQAKFAAIEINSQFAAIFKATHPNVPLFEDSVENVRAICDSMNVTVVDCVVSGLPWAFFSKSLQISILDQLMRVLKPGGTFVTFGYLHSSLTLPAAWNFAALLPDYFTFVSKSPVVWRNLPPAFVYRCRR